MRICAQAMMPYRCRPISWAASFMGSTLERMTFVHQPGPRRALIRHVDQQGIEIGQATGFRRWRFAVRVAGCNSTVPPAPTLADP